MGKEKEGKKALKQPKQSTISKTEMTIWTRKCNSIQSHVIFIYPSFAMVGVGLILEEQQRKHRHCKK